MLLCLYSVVPKVGLIVGHFVGSMFIYMVKVAVVVVSHPSVAIHVKRATRMTGALAVKMLKVMPKKLKEEA